MDALTKVLPQDSFRRCVTLMCLLDRTELAEALGHQGRDYWALCGASNVEKYILKIIIKVIDDCASYKYMNYKMINII